MLDEHFQQKCEAVLRLKMRTGKEDEYHVFSPSHKLGGAFAPILNGGSRKKCLTHSFQTALSAALQPAQTQGKEGLTS